MYNDICAVGIILCLFIYGVLFCVKYRSYGHKDEPKKEVAHE